MGLAAAEPAAFSPRSVGVFAEGTERRDAVKQAGQDLCGCHLAGSAFRTPDRISLISPENRALKAVAALLACIFNAWHISFLHRNSLFVKHSFSGKCFLLFRMCPENSCVIFSEPLGKIFFENRISEKNTCRYHLQSYFIFFMQVQLPRVPN